MKILITTIIFTIIFYLVTAFQVRLKLNHILLLSFISIFIFRQISSEFFAAILKFFHFKLWALTTLFEGIFTCLFPFILPFLFGYCPDSVSNDLRYKFIIFYLKFSLTFTPAYSKQAFLIIISSVPFPFILTFPSIANFGYCSFFCFFSCSFCPYCCFLNYYCYY